MILEELKLALVQNSDGRRVDRSTYEGYSRRLGRVEVGSGKRVAETSWQRRSFSSEPENFVGTPFALSSSPLYRILIARSFLILEEPRDPLGKEVWRCLEL